MKDLLAHPKTIQNLNNIIDIPANAIGISGELGAGRGYLAQILIAQILDIKDPNAYPYYMRIDSLEDKKGINDIREVQNFLKLTVPGSNKYKRAVLIEHIDKLGHEAQNALLKTLEEPPVDTIILITYRSKSTILPTISSRVQELRVLPVDQATAITKLEKPQTEIIRAFHISEGQAGLLSALLNEDLDHPLKQGIESSKELLRASKYQRLIMVDKIIKSDKPSPDILLDGLHRLIRASYKNSVTNDTNVESNLARLLLIDQAISDLSNNVQAKIVFNRLFASL